MRKRPIILSQDRCVSIEGDWRLHFAEGDAVLRGIFSVAGRDYFADGKPLTPGAPKIISVMAP
ncbi:MAG: hypothetical protein QM647_14990 [Asticcacaulis sp.]|uniref:hypothetical protein n=1 Tax=Asticcacaulis sp. TaxID=1872648 RepID=UPI0039E310A2